MGQGLSTHAAFILKFSTHTEIKKEDKVDNGSFDNLGHLCP